MINKMSNDIINVLMYEKKKTYMSFVQNCNLRAIFFVDTIRVKRGSYDVYKSATTKRMPKEKKSETTIIYKHFFSK